MGHGIVWSKCAILIHYFVSICMQENKILIPLSLVIAGLLIGGAVYFKGNTPSGTDTTKEPTEVVVTPLSQDDHVLGNPNAPVTIIEFSDIDCPFCKTFDATMRQIMAEYGNDGKVSWVYRHFPLDSLHPNARAKAESSECVAALGGNEAFWKYLGFLFERDETVADLSAIAVEVGVDKTAFESCVAAKQYAQNVSDDSDAAVAAGAGGTPYTVVIAPNGEKAVVNGAQPYAVVKQIIETALLQTK